MNFPPGRVNDVGVDAAAYDCSSGKEHEEAIVVDAAASDCSSGKGHEEAIVVALMGDQPAFVNRMDSGSKTGSQQPIRSSTDRGDRGDGGDAAAAAALAEIARVSSDGEEQGLLGIESAIGRIIRVLVEGGADINLRMDDGSTPLHVAATQVGLDLI